MLLDIDKLVYVFSPSLSKFYNCNAENIAMDGSAQHMIR